MGGVTDFLLELRSEEIPARMQENARTALEVLFINALEKVGIDARTESYATPRRLALIARDLPTETAATSEEFKGPRTSAPAQALEGFLRKTGLTQDQLQDRDGVWFAVVERPGRATADVLAEAIPAIIRAFPWPKSMRWGRASLTTESLRWVRPLQGIVAIFGNDVLPIDIDGIVSGAVTMGHRFHHSGPVIIASAASYADQLRAANVIVDQDERRTIIRTRAAELAAERGLTWIADEALVAENAGLTEWPVPLIGDFDPAFLDVPPEVIRLTLATNQKYFVCAGPDGRLAPAFICTANIEAHDGGAAIVAGNRKVLAARLSDARFFWEQDQKKTLEQHAQGLARITFHEKLGTVADKVERVAKLARWLVEEGIVGTSPLPLRGGAGGGESRAMPNPEAPPHPNPSPEGEGLMLADLAEQAARLCKADLVTEMVGEFPELQGLMGGYYARAEGRPDAVADAIRDHYKPVGQGDAVPTAPVTVAVSLADKLDTIFGFFLIDEKPTGSKDPFALRRATLAVFATLVGDTKRLSLLDTFWAWLFFAISRAKVSKPQLGWTPWLEDLLHKPEILNVFDESHIVDTPCAAELPSRMSHASARVYARVAAAFNSVLDFFADRLKVQQREAGVRHDLIDAVFALGGEDDLVRLLARVHALQAFVGTEDGTNLLAGYKRAANILKKDGADLSSTPAKAGVQGDIAPTAANDDSGPLPPQGNRLDYTPEPAEAALIAALDTAEPRAAAAVAEERFGDAMAALATLRAPIDAFFETVTVNDADQAKRAARLALLGRLTAAVNAIADFSKIEG